MFGKPGQENRNSIAKQLKKLYKNDTKNVNQKLVDQLCNFLDNLTKLFAYINYLIEKDEICDYEKMSKKSQFLNEKLKNFMTFYSSLNLKNKNLKLDSLKVKATNLKSECDRYKQLESSKCQSGCGSNQGSSKVGSPTASVSQGRYQLKPKGSPSSPSQPAEEPEPESPSGSKPSVDVGSLLDPVVGPVTDTLGGDSSGDSLVDALDKNDDIDTWDQFRDKGLDAAITDDNNDYKDIAQLVKELGLKETIDSIANAVPGLKDLVLELANLVEKILESLTETVLVPVDDSTGGVISTAIGAVDGVSLWSVVG